MRYECTVQDVIIASILHDTVEDHPFDMAREFAKNSPENETEARAHSLQYLTNMFGSRVSEIVEAVSNPIAPKNPNKDEARSQYVDHVLSVIHDPHILLVKFSDFVDNAVGLYHSTGGSERVQHLGKKYTPLVPAFRARLKLEPENIPVSAEGLANMKNHLAQGETRLRKILTPA
jgi:(p)ppGpp synthase/HD superfamily hydrolase